MVAPTVADFFMTAERAPSSCFTKALGDDPRHHLGDAVPSERAPTAVIFRPDLRCRVVKLASR